MPTKSKVEKDACYGSGPYVGLLKTLIREGADPRCAVCDSEAVTAGLCRISGTIGGRPIGKFMFLCRTCHPAHERYDYPETPVPGITMISTRCVTTFNRINEFPRIEDLPHWLAQPHWYMPDDLPTDVNDMDDDWKAEASKPYQYLAPR